MYDIFFVSNDIAHPNFLKLKERFPLAKLANSFEHAKQRSLTKFFWTVWPELVIDRNFNFDYKITGWDKDYIHVFKNGKFYDGISLQSKTIKLSSKEIDHRFYINKKEIDIQASIPLLFDIVFISYNETTADQNYKNLKERFPEAKRIHGVKGIHQAHIEAAKISTTEMFWIVDADAEIVEDFDFSYRVAHYDTYSKLTVHVWRSRNPVTNLEYGYGGVKLLPKQLTINMDTNTTDMTMNISKSFKVMPTVSNITAFNTDPFSAWRSAFRECVKLSVTADAESIERLNAWCVLNNKVSYGEQAHLGALAGRAYGEKNASNKEALMKINDFTWLRAHWLTEKSRLLLEHKQ